ncbi:MAG: LysR family transcriptional regulator, partial [Bacteroidaceae bacterium]
MEKRIRLTAFLLLMSLTTLAQRITLTGSVTDATDGGPLPGTSVVLLNSKDSTQVTGISTDENGKFRMPAVKAGKYIMRLTFVGYITQWKNITLEKGKKEVDMGTISMKENASLLKEAEVITSVAQVEMKADTFVYNADTYKLPEGSALEELVKKLPGAEVSDDGTIKINGKTNFSRAAETLYISQPALSYQIAELERELGTELFVRDRRKVSLTPEGAALLAPARQMLEQAALLPEVVRKLLIPINRQHGDDLPVSAFAGYEDGVMDLGMTAYEKRGIAVALPAWQADKCLQCNLCSLVCPHAAIRPFLLT